MQKVCKIICIAFLFWYPVAIIAQEHNEKDEEPDLSILEELDLDTLTLIDLIDSLLTLEEPGSQLTVNTGYISQITSSGRDLDFRQYGFNMGAGYFHKSGLFASLNGFWYSDFDPNYGLTAVSLGYMGFLGKKTAYFGSYDHSFFTSDNAVGFNNSFNGTVMFDFKVIEPYLDYSFYFGDGSAHRISPGITLDLKKRNWLIFESVSFRPTFSVVFGTAEIVNTKLQRTDDQNFERFLSRRPRLKEFLESGASPEEIDLLLQFYPRLQEFLAHEGENVFGLMNYGFSFPLSLGIGSVNFVFNYTYNIPEELPGELFELSPNDYISLSLSYKFKL